MDKSIPNAFIFMFKDSEWLYKVFILLMLYLPSAYYSNMLSEKNLIGLNPNNIDYQGVLFCVLLIALTMTISTGYLAKCTHNIIKYNGEKSFMPNWEDDFWNYLLIGLKKAIAVTFTSLLLLPTIFLFAIPPFIFSFIFLALDNVFCIDFKLSAYFDWKKAFSIIVDNKQLYFIILFLAAILSIIPSLCYLLKLPTILFSLLFAACMTYTTLVYAYLIGIASRDSED